MPISSGISPTQSNILQQMGNFLLAVLPPGATVLTAQPNRVAEPQASDFVLMTPIRFTRLDTNLDTGQDVVFTGSCAAGVLTVSAMAHGSIATPATMFGVNVPSGVQIMAQTGGTPGGVGTYSLNQSFTLGPETFASGVTLIQINAEQVIQLDFHSQNDLTSSDWAQTVSAAFRDDYATRWFAGFSAPLNRITPLLADDPAQRPFINDQQQYEWRWVLDARLQVNQIILPAQQFAQQVKVGLIEVDSTYPP